MDLIIACSYLIIIVLLVGAWLGKSVALLFMALAAVLIVGIVDIVDRLVDKR